MLHPAGVPDCPCRRGPLRSLRVHPTGAGAPLRGRPPRARGQVRKDAAGRARGPSLTFGSPLGPTRGPHLPCWTVRHLRVVPEDRIGSLRQRVRALGLLEVRVRRSRAPDEPAAARRRGRRAGHAGAGLHHGDFYRIRPRRDPGGRPCHRRHLPSWLRLRCPHRAHHPRLRDSPVLAGLLDGANVASLALMAGVTWQLGRASLVEPVPALLALAALVMLFATEVNPAWLVLGGGSLGFAYHYLLG